MNPEPAPSTAILTSPEQDWSRSPAAMVCAAILGLASVWGLVWSINHESRQTTEFIATSEAPALHAPARLLIDLNTASADELQLLPSIGPAIASRIVEDRSENGPFTELKDLDRVRGIGPKTIAKLTDWVTLSQPIEQSIAQSPSEP